MLLSWIITPVMWENFGMFAAVLIVVLVVLLLWRRGEIRRKKANKLAQQLYSWGLESLAELVEAYANFNWFGAESVTRVAHRIVDELREGGLLKMLRKVGWKVVKGVFLKDADDRKVLQKLLSETTADQIVDDGGEPSVEDIE